MLPTPREEHPTTQARHGYQEPEVGGQALQPLDTSAWGLAEVSAESETNGPTAKPKVNLKPKKRDVGAPEARVRTINITGVPAVKIYLLRRLLYHLKH